MTTLGPNTNLFVDDGWYLTQYSDVRKAIASAMIESAQDHFVSAGAREGRLPRRPEVDEAWYVATNADVAEAIRNGQFVTAFEHFVRHGYEEGRRPNRYAR